ncbi:MAG: hypothetical protein OHK0046_03080 [Anaerolineae bacterium]
MGLLQFLGVFLCIEAIACAYNFGNALTHFGWWSYTHYVNHEFSNSSLIIEGVSPYWLILGLQLQ